MPQVARSLRFVEKAEAALVGAIEIYNKPHFRYREESFSILALNAWELLLKARLLALSGNQPRVLFVYERRPLKSGKPGQKLYLKRNRSNNCETLSLGKTIVALEKRGSAPDAAVRRNLEALAEIRDNAVHYVAAGPLLAKQVWEIGTAAVMNFLRLAKEWFERDLSNCQIYLMPIGFVAPPKDGTIVVTADEANLVKFISNMVEAESAPEDAPFQVALTLHLNLKRSTAPGASKVAITSDPDATQLTLSEEDFKARYPWDYKDLTDRLRARYTDFKATDRYHALRRPLMKDQRYCLARFLDPGNENSARKDFYSPNILSEFDKAYTRATPGE
jgi:hypothetical protein